jgi:tetratricopeptide (TPR) repeat protein
MVDERENIRPPEKSLAPGGKPDAKVVAPIPPQKDIPIGFGVISPEMERYRAMIVKDPTSRVFAALAELYRKAGMLDEAVRLCLDGTKAHPKYMSGRVALARAYFDKGMIKEAKEEILTVVSITPDNIVAHKILGDIYLLEGDAVSARESFGKVLSLSPDDAESKQKLGQAQEISTKDAAQPRETEEILDGEALEVVAEGEPPAISRDAMPLEGDDVIVSKAETAPAAADESRIEGGEKTDESGDLDIPIGDDVSLDDLLADELADDTGRSQADVESDADTGISTGDSNIEEEMWEVEEGPLSSTVSAADEGLEVGPDQGMGDGDIDIEEDQELVDEFGILDEGEGDITVEGLDSDQGPIAKAPGGSPQGKAPESSEIRAPQRPPVTVESAPEKKADTSDAQGITITTETIADIYVKQGYFDKALSVYEELLGVYPTRDSLKEKISFVKSKIREMPGGEHQGTVPIDGEATTETPGFSESADDERLQNNIGSLNRWLLTIRKFRRL